MKYSLLLASLIFCLCSHAEDAPNVDTILEVVFKRIAQHFDNLSDAVEKDPNAIIDTRNTRDLFHRTVMESSDQRLKILFAITDLNNAIDYIERMGNEGGFVNKYYLQMIKRREILAKEYVALGTKQQSEQDAPAADPTLKEVFKKIAPRVDNLPDGVEKDSDAVMRTSNALGLFHRTVMGSSEKRLKILFAIASLNAIIDHLGGPEVDLDANDGIKKDYLQMIKLREILAKEYVALGTKQRSEPGAGVKPE